MHQKVLRGSVVRDETEVLSLTPRSNSYGVEWQSPEESNLGSRCMVTGEPFHDVISLRRAVATSAPDCRDLIFDHMDLIGRLSEPLAPCTSVVSKAKDGLFNSPQPRSVC